MTNKASWQPAADLKTQKKRAALYRQLREFMQQRDILEVETPILSHYGISDPYIHSLRTEAVSQRPSYYLHTSPEYCMKRLLAAGAGSIYQIARVFRDDERGKRHLTEFSMLEWYRVGFSYYQLMDEMADLMTTLGLPGTRKTTYADAFNTVLKTDPLLLEPSDLCELVNQHGWQTDSLDQHECLDFLFSSVVIPGLDTSSPLLVHDYPSCMAALSTIKADNPKVCERFELFINGMEIANGFNELTDASEQRDRFEKELQNRQQLQQHVPELDTNFLAALQAGLPACAGVALGLDRLLMVLCDKTDIRDVMSFTLDNN